MDAITKLIQQSKIKGGGMYMKVKWNACYAIGNFMRNPVMFSIEDKSFYWQELVFPTLCDLIVNCTNFKVRINGVAALAVPAKRIHYGSHFTVIWNAMLHALDQANHLTDFSEYNHRDNLLDQLCISVSHLILLAIGDDWTEMKDILLQHVDAVKQNWIRVINRMVPERAASLLAANLHLKNELKLERLTAEQKASLSVLSSCFTSITEYEN